MSVICQKSDLNRDWALVETPAGRQASVDADGQRFVEMLTCLNALFDTATEFAVPAAAMPARSGHQVT